MAKEEKKQEFLPTQPAPLRPGELATKDDILMDYIQRHDTGLEGFRRDESHLEPANMMKEVTVNRKSSVKHNWFAANVYSIFAL